MQTKQAVIFDHDGGVDDLLSLMLLLTMEHIDLLGVTVTPADCYLSDATTSTLKLLSMFGREDVPVAKGTLHGINAFPADWRAQPKMCNALPMMLTAKANTSQISELPAHEFIATALKDADNVTLLMTGPCTNLTAAMDLDPNIKSSIKELVWMGGAVHVPGNVSMHNHNTSAEWNAFWDPIATKALFESGINVKLISLDSTNALPVDIAFLERLAAMREHAMADLAGQFWALTVNSIPAYEFTYYMWDVLATSYLGLPDGTIQFEKTELDVSVDEPNAGETFVSEGTNNLIDVSVSVNKDVVLDYVASQFARDFNKRI
ncbi:nucleoside hydrolase [Aestuariibacter sp. AA17]|uniref:Nucleoside hydrolase n=1 Tax=Fluctibacter corallii TaxID=2984329 RepID=A0ABT3A961_9ALTE|nr:nucleoside hydrolase [Aestuariibacter sp. AA17]MCV2885218.1 nucleoside hydrolase [Aestuariibacter sp. AA17]